MATTTGGPEFSLDVPTPSTPAIPTASVGSLGFSVKDVLYSRLGLGLNVFVILFLVNVVLQPQFLVIKSVDPLEEPRFSYKRALVLSLALASLFLFLSWYSTRSKQLNR